MPASLAGRLPNATAAAAWAARSRAARVQLLVPSRLHRQRGSQATAAAGPEAASSQGAAQAGGDLRRPTERPLQPALECGTTSAHKALNAQLCSAETAEQLLELVQRQLHAFNITNAVTAFHRIAKAAQALPGGKQGTLGALRSHAVVRRLVALLEEAAPTFTDLHVSQLLWAHSHLGHASPALVAALYDRLDSAEVAPQGGTPSSYGSSASSSCYSSGSVSSFGSGASGASSGPAPLQPLLLSNMSAATNLCYALAKLGRPPPACVRRLAVVLLLEAEAAEEAAEDASLQLEGDFAGWGLLDSTEDEEAAEGGAQHGGSGSGPQPGGPSGPYGQQGISLAASDPRGLCLLMWSLAELDACPPALLRHTMASLRRRRELGRLSVQSMGHVLLAAQRLAAAAGQQQLEQQQQQEQEQEWGAPVLSGVQREQRRWQQRFRWDQAFMDAVAAELAGRAKRAHRRPGQRPPRPFHLNEQDCSALARAFAAAWQEAAAASGAPTDNRLKLAGAIRRHVDASPARRAALRLLHDRSRELAPRLRVQALSALAQAFACIGSCPPKLLEAVAQRAIDLEEMGRLDAQGVSSLAWAFSTLQYDHPQLFDVLASAAVRMLQTQPGSKSDGSIDSSSSGGGGGGSSAPGSRRAGCTRADFSAHTVSVLVFSFASANRCDSPAQRQMYTLLGERADEVLEQFTPQGLANLAWGLTVAACYPPQLMRRWRTLAGGRAVQFGPAELNQLHLVEVALRLETPDIGLEAPAEARSFFDSLYRAGRLRAFAGAGWAANQAGGPRSVTDFQRQVHEAVCALGVPCVLEHSQAGEYSIDIAIPSDRIAVEVDGPVHFATNSRHLMGGTALKRRLLQRLGWQAVAVPFYDWWHLPPSQRGPYMRRKLQQAGLQLPGINAAAQEAGKGSAVQPREQRQAKRQEERQQRQGRHQQPTVQQQPPSVQQPAGANGAPLPAEGAPTMQQQPPTADVAAEEPAAVEPAVAAASEAVPWDPAAGLAQRAQRLSMIQYKQGKLSKAGLLARGSLQAAAAGGKPAGGSGGQDGNHNARSSDGDDGHNGNGSSGGDSNGSQAAP